MKVKKTLPYIIGIDLGTTNCTMAYLAPTENAEIEQFAIPQVTASGTEAEAFSLPSFLYFSLEEERKKKQCSISWEPTRHFCVGLHAKNRGSEVPTRVVSSAKSWLCHSGIDRREKILPLQSSDEKMSPIEVCAELLKHLREAWDQKNQEILFAEQQIFITVPASFDPAARELVLEAAEKAGYPQVVLLEEPLAAFYAWLQKEEKTWRKQLTVGDTVLVIDIGGGTTDFSLISVEEEKGDLALNRVAVGAHLLLGGDNIDCSLAYFAKQKLEDQGHGVDDWQMQSLTHSCRSAKEKFLGDKPPKSLDLAVMGRGSKLIGGSIKVPLALEEVKKLILEGFFPLSSPEELSATEKRLGFSQIGLPFAQDPRISHQLARFLSQAGESDQPAMDKFVVPTAVLFNGGTLKALELRKRILQLLNHWAQLLDKPPLRELEGIDLDNAVSRGAVSYGHACGGKGIRVKSGTSRSYYIGIEEAVPAIPGMQIPIQAICIVPFGMEEGSELLLEDQEFSLALGQKASFQFFSCSAPSLQDGAIPTIGTVVRKWKGELQELHPIESLMEKEDKDGKTICVKLKSRVTELGVLELWCVAQDGRKWKLAFDIRE